MRKLVTVRKISNIEPIPEADFIEKVEIDGWNVVVKKGEFKKDDYCIYAEIDSIFSVDDERFSFLNGKPIKTKKIKGIISQGICFPVSIIDKGVELDEDLTEYFNVIKYEPPLPYDQRVLGNKPRFILDTSIERVQNLESKDLIDKSYIVTEKIDGTAISVYCVKDDEGNFKIGLCSRNLELDINYNSKYLEAVNKYNIFEKLKSYCQKQNEELILQGELISSKIQGNKYKLSNNESKIFFYRAYTKKAHLLSYFELDKLILDLNLKNSIVPFIYSCNVNTIDIKEADGKSLLNEKVNREGLVFIDIENPRFQFKMISNKFLLKHE